MNRYIPAYERGYCPDCHRMCEPLYKELGQGDWELICNYCGSAYVEEAKECDICGEVHPMGKTELFRVCEACLDNLDIVIDEAVKKMMRGTMLTYEATQSYIAERIEEVTQ